MLCLAHMKKITKHKLLEPKGLCCLLVSFCWQIISDAYKNREQQAYQSNIDDIIISTADLVASYAFRDTENYIGKTITNFNPDDVHIATFSYYLHQDESSRLYQKHRRYFLIQVLLYILGSVWIIVGSTYKAINE